EHEITCIITDYLMPRMNGLQLCENIRSLCKRIPIFLITAFLERERFEKLKCFDEKFTKPLDFSQLVEKISYHQFA
nr:response regulator [Candidatus Sigynarchaeota archaeon]